MERNQLVDLKPLSSLIRLRDIIASHNCIASIEGIDVLPQLQIVELCHNPVADDPSFRITAIYQITSLKVTVDRIAEWIASTIDQILRY